MKELISDVHQLQGWRFVAHSRRSNCRAFSEHTSPQTLRIMIQGHLNETVERLNDLRRWPSTCRGCGVYRWACATSYLPTRLPRRDRSCGLCLQSGRFHCLPQLHRYLCQRTGLWNVNIDGIRLKPHDSLEICKNSCQGDYFEMFPIARRPSQIQVCRPCGESKCTMRTEGSLAIDSVLCVGT